MKRRLVEIPSVALAAVLCLGPAPLRAQNVAARAVVPVIGQGLAVGAVSLSLTSARFGLPPTLSAPSFLVPALVVPSLMPSVILAAQPQVAAPIIQPAVVPASPITKAANAQALDSFSQSAAADDAVGKVQALNQLFDNTLSAGADALGVLVQPAAARPADASDDGPVSTAWAGTLSDVFALISFRYDAPRLVTDLHGLDFRSPLVRTVLVPLVKAIQSKGNRTAAQVATMTDQGKNGLIREAIRAAQKNLSAEVHLLMAEAKSPDMDRSRLGRIVRSMDRLEQVAPYYLEPAEVQVLQTARAQAQQRFNGPDRR